MYNIFTYYSTQHTAFAYPNHHIRTNPIKKVIFQLDVLGEKIRRCLLRCHSIRRAKRKDSLPTYHTTACWGWHDLRKVKSPLSESHRLPMDSQRLDGFPHKLSDD